MQFLRSAYAAAFLVLFCAIANIGTAAAQSPTATTDSPLAASVPPSQMPGEQLAPHRFWDLENDLLFAAVAGARGLDYSSTLNMRRRGRQEIFLTNSVVDNHPLFAGIEVASVGASLAISYALHRTGHHRIERWVSAVHAAVATGGAVRNYNLKTAHGVPAP